MNIPIKKKEQVMVPPKGYVFPFVDKDDMRLKAKLSDGLIIDYTGIDNQKTLSLSDYTSFEIYANDTVIPVGQNKELGGYVNKEIAVGMTEKFCVRTSSSPQNQDVVIYWGDGEYTDLSNMSVDSFDEEEKEYNYVVSHTYKKSGKYIIKVYGKQYFNINHSDKYGCINLMCRFFDSDLSIASNLLSLNKTCERAERLLYIHIPSYDKVLKIMNWYGCFKNCVNLITAMGFKRIQENILSGVIFYNCCNMIKTDFRLPYAGTYEQAFQKCQKLQVDISELQPAANNIRGVTKNVSNVFNGCKNITGTISVNKWWNDKQVTWTNNKATFSGCSDAIRNQVPQSWGGNVPDIIA